MIRFFGSLFVLVAGLVVIGSILHYDLLTQFHHLINSIFNIGQQAGQKLTPHVKHVIHNFHPHVPTTTGH